MPAAPLRDRRSVPDMLRWSGWWLVVVCVLTRCLVTLDPFPHWALDPGRVNLPITGLTPAASMSVDSVMLLGCGVAMAGEVMAGAAVLWLPMLLWALGCVGVAVQAFVMRAGSVDDARIGISWIAAFGAGLTAMHLCRDERVKRLTLAASIGIIAMLAAKGAIQVFHEHAMTVQRFRADREGFLASQGWTPDSASARNFERRLNQPEATGWFGLSNVYATFAAAGVVALLGCAGVAWREARVRRRIPDGWAGLLTLGMLAAMGALILAGSKGGYGAAALGLGVMTGLALLGRVPRIRGPRAARIGGIVAVTVIGAVIVGVAVRGIVGERVGELSLLFRSFYMHGALRAFAENPVFGVGPDGFKDAYMRLKPALSPEEVSSPHSVLFDLAARVGVFGVLWGGLWLRWVYGLGVTAVRTGEPAESAGNAGRGNARMEGWLVVLAAAAPVMVSTWFERAMGSPEQALARVAGLAGWVGVSIALVALLRVSKVGHGVIAVAALVVAMHGQVEVTPLWDSSAAWVCLVLGAAGVSGGGVVMSGVQRRSTRSLLAPGILVAAAAAAAWLGVARASEWESVLQEGAERMHPMADIRARLGELGAGRAGESDSMPQLLEDLARSADTQVPASAAEMDRAMALLAFKCATNAAPFLERASRLAPRHFATCETWVRVLMEGALAADASGRPGDASRLAKEALVQAREFAQRRPTSSSLGLVGNVESSLFSLTKEQSHLDGAVSAWEAGARLDPHGLSLPLQVLRALVAADRREAAKVVARRLIDLDSLQRLDELKRLSPVDKAMVDRVLAGN
jgi:hypothetical protein